MSKPEAVFWMVERRDMPREHPLLFTASSTRREALRVLWNQWFEGDHALPRREWRKYRARKWCAAPAVRP